MNRDLYQEVTDRIVASLEAGVAPWIKPVGGGCRPDSRQRRKPQAIPRYQRGALEPRSASARLRA